MRSLSIIILAVVALGLAACSENDSTPNTPVNTAPLWPLAVGNMWIYQQQTIIDDTVLSTDYDTIRVIDSERDSVGNTWYITNEGSEGSHPRYRNSSRGLEVKQGEMHIVLANSGRTGEMEMFETTDEPLGIRLEATEVEVTTPAGTFSCFKFAFLEGGMKLENWMYIAPGIGYIKREGNPETRHVLINSELIEYHLE